IPLVVLTADRPHELRDVGAPQTINQINLFGAHVKWFMDLAEPDAAPEMLRYTRTVAARAVALARRGPAGPVHINCPYREPLLPYLQRYQSCRLIVVDGDGGWNEPTLLASDMLYADARLLCEALEVALSHIKRTDNSGVDGDSPVSAPSVFSVAKSSAWAGAW